ncbi:hypothetical protein C7H19_19935 [Aphanothece hegewaldii CCALA 016]|uniref:Uncharacterized protein n=1 Tax=Aphanothece hegewaldii CCALA 016 TaxID=2107694 RepID=A0A2T1LSZ9_9CHRO|nr:hypothetical protein [Aphanothece hegewaldii]PSF33443.1 hypothetical protein C7H19_19935 [Aphanothece hegewaldii CCALA 016]
MSLLLGKFKERGASESLALKDAYSKLILICLGGVVGGLLLQLLLFIGLNRVANQPPPVLVQLKDGSSIKVEAIDSLSRTDQSIQSFVNDTLALMFTWSGVVPGDAAGQYTADQGVVILDEKGQRKGRVTTAAWEATYALELQFRQEFLRQLADLVPETVFVRKTNVAFVPLKILSPEPISLGKWKVRIYSNLLFVTADNQTAEIVPYNVDVYVHAVPPSNLALTSQVIDIRSKPIAAIVGKVRQAAMEIEAIVPIKQEDLK